MSFAFFLSRCKLSGCPVIGVRHGVQPLIQWYLDSFEPGPHPMDGRASVMWRFINQVLILDYQAEIHHVFKAYGNSGSMRIDVNKLLACSGRMLLSTSSRMKAHIFCLPAWRTWSKSVTCWLGSLFLLAMLSAPDSCSCMPIVHGKPGWKHTWVESKYCGGRKNIF